MCLDTFGPFGVGNVTGMQPLHSFAYVCLCSAEMVLLSVYVRHAHVLYADMCVFQYDLLHRILCEICHI